MKIGDSFKCECDYFFQGKHYYIRGKIYTLSVIALDGNDSSLDCFYFISRNGKRQTIVMLRNEIYRYFSRYIFFKYGK